MHVTIHKNQISRIWAAAREIGLDKDGVYDLIERVSGGRSLRALTVDQAGAVIDSLVRAGASKPRKPSGRRLPKGVKKLLTGGQRDEIERLRGELGGKWLEEPYFAGACKRLIRAERPSTGHQGSRVIEMLKQRVATAKKASR